MAEIILNNGTVCLVDDADFAWLNQWKWRAHVRPNGVYARRNTKVAGRRVTILMHRQIMGAGVGDQVDHRRAGETLDNRRDNLRLCNNSQNCGNKRLSAANTSGFKGVDVRPWGFAARIKHQGTTHHLGTYRSAAEAARAYDVAAQRYFGEFARLNFPDEVAV